MIELRDIHCVRLGTRDLDAAEDFGVNILGLQSVERTDKRVYLRSDWRHHTVSYFLGDVSENTFAYELKHWDALDDAIDQMKAAGIPCGMGTDEEAADRKVHRFGWFKDPTGNKIELLSRPFDANRPYHPNRPTGISGIGHVGLNTTDPVRDQTFWMTHFNARVSDWIGNAALMRVNPRHHQMALFPTTKPGIQHINHQVATIDDLLKAAYFMQERNIRIVFGPGRHATSGGYFLYFEGHDGMTFEYSTSDRMIIEDEDNYRPRQFPMEDASFCLFGSKPDIPEFRK